MNSYRKYEMQNNRIMEIIRYDRLGTEQLRAAARQNVKIESGAIFRLIPHTPGPEIRMQVAYIYIDTPCAYPPSYPSIRYT